jgi:hypothetical protein
MPVPVVARPFLIVLAAFCGAHRLITRCGLLLASIFHEGLVRERLGLVRLRLQD